MAVSGAEIVKRADGEASVDSDPDAVVCGVAVLLAIMVSWSAPRAKISVCVWPVQLNRR